MTGSPKNLLLLISDEHRRDAMGCAGHPLIQTPHLDALAARGTLFENACTPSPMCVPARAAIACGDHVHRIGHWDSATPYDGRHRSWMHTVRDAGVETTSIGKLHFRSAQDDNGFSREVMPMHVVDGVGWTIGLLRDPAPPFDAAAELAADVGPGRSSYTDYDLAITAAAEEWLAGRERGAGPWATVVSLVSPHYPLVAPPDYYALYDPATVDMPVGYDAALRPDHPELRNIAAFFDYDRHFDEARLRAAKVAYYGLTSFMDACIGRILAALEASGQAQDTVVLYVSDHGEMLGDLGFWTKQVMYESSVGVPMIAAGPGVPVGRHVKTATSLIDLAPTAMDVTGVTAERALPGSSLRGLAHAPDDPDRTVFSEYHDGGSTTGTFMVRWGRWKYVAYIGHPPQLFDLEADPHELTNRAADPDPSSRAALAEGDKRLRAICDPEAVNRRCFADQSARIASLGGAEACATRFGFNHTPTPTE